MHGYMGEHYLYVKLELTVSPYFQVFSYIQIIITKATI
jgi:hypothetical protein